MKLQIKKGTTSKLITVFIQDSSSTTGAGLTGLVYNSAGLTAYYYREGAGTGATAITLATMTLGTWATGGFIVVDATNMPGVYEIGLPDAVLASGADSVSVMLKGATNMAPLTLEIQLTDIDLHDSVRGGMTALPNAAADAAGGLPISDAGGLDLDAMNTAAVRLTAARAQIIDDWANGGRLDLILDIIAADTTTDIPALIATAQADLDIITDTDGVILGAAGVDLIWDELMTGHTTNQTAGKILKGISEGWISAEASVNDASATTTSFITDLTNATDNFYNDTVLVFITGTLTGQSRPITSYNGTTKTVTFDEAFTSAPANADQFIILNGHVHPVSEIVAGVVGDAVIAELTTQGDTNEAAIAALNNLSAAQVNAEMVDALATDTYAEPGQGAPAATTSIAAKINYLYKAWRNKTEQTATTLSIYDDAGTTVDQKSTVSDDATTATKGEIISGP